MILVRAIFQLRADAKDRALEAAQVMQGETLREPGCLEYRFATSIDDEHQLLLFESWSDRESLDAHLNTPHFAVFADVLRACTRGRSEVEWFRVTDHGQLM